MLYRWIREKFPGCRVRGQALQRQGGRYYDILHLVMPDGEKKDVWFDITEFFGLH